MQSQPELTRSSPCAADVDIHTREGTSLGGLLCAVLISSLLVGGVDAREVLTTHKLADDVYALVGPLSNRDAENLGNNANFGVVLTEEGVVLIDPGGTYQGAQMIDAAIGRITDKPVILVINTGGQDHRWL